ncbi:porin family protein [Hymenobacter guriensis]|uniref:PorT family protein n=1 Tax=Hymenobacter guriensis TaxID=2793065 RepID=A0ABS0L2J5_9BACT|nr:porin family protein [Hymenobacter guriensis]MBG8554349.1 PorT family protein [Hymenobacter guriensis]
MKKLFLPLFFGVASLASVQAQGVRLGLTAGMTAATVGGPRNANTPEPDGRLGARVGLTARLPLTASGRLALQTELAYAGLGFHLKAASGNYVAFRERLHYLQLPVLMQLRLSRLWLEAGPQVSYLLGHRWLDGPGGLLGSPNIYTDNTEKFHRWDFSAVVGAGYQLTDKLGVGLRYAHGLTPVYQPVSADGTPPGRLRNRSLSLNLSYQLGR